MQILIIGVFEAFNPSIGLKRTVSEAGRKLLRIKSDLKRKSERATIAIFSSANRLFYQVGVYQ